jgi:prepilin-type N-terminal cleavage/methylation domain-containing protein
MNKKGFSLIEVAIAIAIISIGLITITSLFISNIKSEIRSKNKLIAIYLANESIEIVRQQRDNNWFSGATGGWLDNISNGSASGEIVVPKSINNIREGWEVKAIVGESDKKIYLTNDNMYLQCDVEAPGSWEETGFKRYLEISTGTAGCSATAGDDCVEVISYVLLNGNQFAKVTAYFYDKWY